MKKSKKTGKLLMVIGVLLFITSVGLTVYNGYMDTRAQKLSGEVLSKIEIPETNTQKIPDYKVNPEMDLPVKEVDGKDYIGTVSVPTLELTLPVMAEWSYSNFKIAPCRYEGTPYKNNFIICAHNYRRHFGGLRDLALGSKVTFKDMDGNIFKYEVIGTDILDNNAVEEMSAGEWDMTLFTCTYGGATRVTVRCKLIAEKPV